MGILNSRDKSINSNIDIDVLAFYKNKLPSQIAVKVHKDNDTNKYWAEVEADKKGDAIFTEASSRDRLEDMVNDAVTTYYEIPERFSRSLLITKIYHDPELKSPRKSVMTA